MQPSELSSALEIYTGGQAPAEASENTAFHQQMVDFLIAGARECGWAGAEICDYDRFGGGVSIGIRPGQASLGWPGLDELRAWRDQHRNDPPKRVPDLVADNSDQRSFAL